MNPGFDEQWLHEVLELLRSEVEPRLLPLFRFCLEHPRDRLSVEDLADGSGFIGGRSSTAWHGQTAAAAAAR
jgi:hypothetical protein